MSNSSLIENFHTRLRNCSTHYRVTEFIGTSGWSSGPGYLCSDQAESSVRWKWFGFSSTVIKTLSKSDKNWPHLIFNCPIRLDAQKRSKLNMEVVVVGDVESAVCASLHLVCMCVPVYHGTKARWEQASNRDSARLPTNWRLWLSQILEYRPAT